MAGLLLVSGLLGCAPRQYRLRADKAAYGEIKRAQTGLFGEERPFTVEQAAITLRRRIMEDQKLPYATPASLSTRNLKPVPGWPDESYFDPGVSLAEAPSNGEQLKLTLIDALKVAALNSRDYQDQKESVFRSALELELQRDAFRSTLTGLLNPEWSTDRTGADTPTGVTTGVTGTGSAEITKRLLNGMELSLQLGLDVAKLYSPSRLTSNALFADGSISIPLLRGRGRLVVGEPLTQAQRNLIYAIYDFERFKQTFAVSVARAYLGVLQSYDQVQNGRQNYTRLIAATRRARRLADAGSLPEIQVDQAVQDELRARQRWVIARENAEQTLDAFKGVLGLPPDASVELDGEDLKKLVSSLMPLAEATSAQRDQGPVPPADAPIDLREPSKSEGGPLELDSRTGIELALKNRQDLRVAEGRVEDAQRRVVVAADGFKAELTLLGSASVGEHRTLSSAGLPDSKDLNFDKGIYSALLTFNPPFERTGEMIAYRESFLDLEAAVRALQATEDGAKLDVRNSLRDLLVAREGLQIQAQALTLAERRVRSTDLFLQAGRAEIRDLLEAQEALLTAQNALTSAMVDYRVAELGLQRDMGLLEIDEEGLWHEFKPGVDDHASGESEPRSNVQSFVD